MSTFQHYSVLLTETIDGMNIQPSGVYVDCTAGGGGHSYEIASRLTEGRLIAIDRDSAAIEAAGNRLSPFSDKVTLVHDNFLNLSDILEGLGINKVNGVLMDLGVSSHQIDTADRGFSYMKDAPLDMRMNREDSLTAYEVVNRYSEEELRRIFFEYGEEKYTPKIGNPRKISKEPRSICKKIKKFEKGGCTAEGNLI